MRRNHVVATGCAGLLALVTPAVSVAAPAGDGNLTPSQQAALDVGIQVAPKESDAAALTARTNPNPYLANLPDITDANYFAWNKVMHERAATRADSARLASNRRAAFGTQGRGTNARGVLTPFVHDEEEPAGTTGSNDSHPDAEPIAGFGTAATRTPAVRILGELAATGSAPRTVTTAEDQGSIPLATSTGIAGGGGRSPARSWATAPTARSPRAARAPTTSTSTPSGSPPARR